MRNITCRKCIEYKKAGWCEKKIDSPDPDIVRDCQYYREKTNADHIRSMDDEELAWELMTWRIETCMRLNGAESQYPYTQKSILDWLRQPYKEDKEDGKTD